MFAEAFACAGIDTLPVDVYASSDVTIMLLNRDKILRPCSEACNFHGKIIENLLQIVARKNIMLNQKLRYTSHKTTRDKLMAYLTDQAKIHQSPDFIIPFDRQGLADYLSVERSAMSAELSKLQKDGIIKTSRSHFTLL